MAGDVDLTAELARARVAAREWAAGSSESPLVALRAYVLIDALVSNGAPPPSQWDRSASVPDVTEVAEALQAVALLMPLEMASVRTIASMIVRVMTDRRTPRPEDQREIERLRAALREQI
jgi:hypothetical protein